MNLSQVSIAKITRTKAATRSIKKADGIAICVKSKGPAQSPVVGVDPQKGISKCDLKGHIIEVINLGKGSRACVDVRQGFSLYDKNVYGEL
jgi:myo-inositol-hexaphosphate 3-phosphohydrolase